MVLNHSDMREQSNTVARLVNKKNIAGVSLKNAHLNAQKPYLLAFAYFCSLKYPAHGDSARRFAAKN